MYKFEVYKDASRQWRFRFIAPNGQVMFSGESYRRKASALKTIRSIKKNVPSAEVFTVAAFRTQ